MTAAAATVGTESWKTKNEIFAEYKPVLFVYIYTISIEELGMALLVHSRTQKKN